MDDVQENPPKDHYRPPTQTVAPPTDPNGTPPPPPQTAVHFAGFWKRVAISSVDTLAMLLAMLAAPSAVIIPVVVNIVLYFWKGRTIGDFVMQTKLVHAVSHKKPSAGQLIGRFFAKILSAIPLNLGFYWAGWTKEKKAWHDSLSGIRYVETTSYNGGITWIVNIVLLIAVPYLQMRPLIAFVQEIIPAFSQGMYSTSSSSESGKINYSFGTISEDTNNDQEEEAVEPPSESNPAKQEELPIVVKKETGITRGTPRISLTKTENISTQNTLTEDNLEKTSILENLISNFSNESNIGDETFRTGLSCNKKDFFDKPCKSGQMCFEDECLIKNSDLSEYLESNYTEEKNNYCQNNISRSCMPTSIGTEKFDANFSVDCKKYDRNCAPGYKCIKNKCTTNAPDQPIRGYLKKDGNVFFDGVLLENVLIESFKQLDPFLAKDSEHIFFGDILVEGASSLYFLLIEKNTGLGSPFILWADVDNVFLNENKILVGVRGAHLKEIDWGYWSDGERIFYESGFMTGAGSKIMDFQRIEGADTETFVHIKSHTAKDKNVVYQFGKKIEGSHGASFEIIDSRNAKDDYHTYVAEGVMNPPWVMVTDTE
jgi:uncharacterized RDD family membrane protein YckC